MRRPDAFFAVLALLLTFATEVAAQTPSALVPGSRVRITRTGGSRVVGSVLSARDGRLVIEQGHGMPLVLPDSSVHAVELSLGRHRKVAAWTFGTAAATGIALGIASAATYEPCESDVLFGCLFAPTSRGEAFTWGLVGGGIVGGAVGLVVGLVVKHDRWQPVTASPGQSPGAAVRVSRRGGGGYDLGLSIPVGGGG